MSDPLYLGTTLPVEPLGILYFDWAMALWSGMSNSGNEQIGAFVCEAKNELDGYYPSGIEMFAKQGE